MAVCSRSVTLIELLISMVIIAVLCAVTMYGLRSARESAYLLQVRTHLQPGTLKSGPKMLGWVTDRTIKIEWTEAATPDHGKQTVVAEFDLDNNTFANITYTPVP